MNQRPFAAVLAGALLLCLTGCASSPVRLTFDETPATTGKSSKPPADALQLIFAPTTDVRPTYQRPNVGQIGGREVVADKLTCWIDRSLQALHGQRFVICHDHGPNVWLVTPRLRQFYTASVAVSKNANVVLELEFQPPAGPAFSRVYRGRINAMNWWNSASEIEGTVFNALGDCLERITRDLDTLEQADAIPKSAGHAAIPASW